MVERIPALVVLSYCNIVYSCQHPIISLVCGLYAGCILMEGILEKEQNEANAGN